MTRDQHRFAWNSRDSFAFSMSGLTLFSVMSLVFSLLFRELSLAVVGVVGLALVAVGLGAWGSSRPVRRMVADLRRGGSVVWPVYAQTDHDLRHRRGILQADKTALALKIKSETIQLNWPDVTSLTLQTGGLFKSGRILVKVPNRGTLILEVLYANALTSIDDSALQECIDVLNECKLGAMRGTVENRFSVDPD